MLFSQIASIQLSQVHAASFLTMHYRLSGEDGADIVNTFLEKPATLTLGTGSLAPALEAKLIGLEEGARLSFDMPAGSTFGDRNPELLQWVKRSLMTQLGDPLEAYQVGDVVQFPTPDGQGSYAGVVRELRMNASTQKPEAYLFDFNHPLAGQAVTFEVQLIGVL
jgi:FKBP-type peptidyl-prolyl cis-trans isomerase SlpA